MTDPKNTPPSPLEVAKPPSSSDQEKPNFLHGMITNGDPLMTNRVAPVRGMAMDAKPIELRGTTFCCKVRKTTAKK